MYARASVLETFSCSSHERDADRSRHGSVLSSLGLARARFTVQHRRSHQRSPSPDTVLPGEEASKPRPVPGQARKDKPQPSIPPVGDLLAAIKRQVATGPLAEGLRQQDHSDYPASVSLFDSTACATSSIPCMSIVLQASVASTHSSTHAVSLSVPAASPSHSRSPRPVRFAASIIRLPSSVFEARASASSPSRAGAAASAPLPYSGRSCDFTLHPPRVSRLAALRP
ncbi:hypothetical protein K466DRAFT_139286 [Polyporus arcularius HHB13444]|uniref:Uncharacterized protein n=1 Tax=Polyporus arcularius HHB13444 TaxID=1314778 RepID=A0A5C3PF02_9APHY|nr:hypothetical protein K466DRAFT_139286 [Polyporus arcularius HHB13444]